MISEFDPASRDCCSRRMSRTSQCRTRWYLEWLSLFIPLDDEATEVPFSAQTFKPISPPPTGIEDADPLVCDGVFHTTSYSRGRTVAFTTNAAQCSKANKTHRRSGIVGVRSQLDDFDCQHIFEGTFAFTLYSSHTVGEAIGHCRSLSTHTR